MGEGIGDAASIEGARAIVRGQEPGRYDEDEIQAEPFPSGPTSRSWGRLIQHSDGRSRMSSGRGVDVYEPSAPGVMVRIGIALFPRGDEPTLWVVSSQRVAIRIQPLGDPRTARGQAPEDRLTSGTRQAAWRP
jgi:hypothetical protein